jgi:hypothetical protein
MVYVIVLSSLFSIFYFTSICAVFGPVSPNPLTRNPKLESRNPKPETRRSRLGTKKTEPETRNPNPKPKPET